MYRQFCQKKICIDKKNLFFCLRKKRILYTSRSNHLCEPTSRVCKRIGNVKSKDNYLDFFLKDLSQIICSFDNTNATFFFLSMYHYLLYFFERIIYCILVTITTLLTIVNKNSLVNDIYLRLKLIQLII